MNGDRVFRDGFPRPEDKERWVERTFTVWLDEGTYGEPPDADEIAYLLRMGGIDADTEPHPKRLT